MRKYIEIVKDKTGVVVDRIDITDKSERSIERCEGGVLINLNHKEFHTRVREYKFRMPKSDESLETQN
jgi:hypothetical protein